MSKTAQCTLVLLIGEIKSEHFISSSTPPTVPSLPLLPSHLLPSLSHPLLSSHFRVVQRNLVFVIGLSPRLADPEVLKRQEYFGRFGKIVKVVINNHTVYTGQQVGVSHWPAGGRVTACLLFTHSYCASAVGLPYMKTMVRISFHHCIF